MAKRSGPAAPPPAPAAANGARMVQVPLLTFRAAVQSAREEDRTVEVIWTTGAAVERYDWMSDTRYLETLSLDPAHVRLERLNAGAPLLDGHSGYSVTSMLGAVVPDSAELTKKEGRATVRFSRRPKVEEVWQDVRDGLVTSVSVGYRVYKYEQTEGKGNALPVRKAIDWEPHELSLVPIPADAGAKVRSEKVETNPCEIVSAETRTEKETPVDPSKPAEFVTEQPVIQPPAAAITAPEPNEHDTGVEAERARVKGIQQACRTARLPAAFMDGLIDSGLSLVECQTRVFAEMATRGGDDRGPGRIPSGPRVEVGEDPIIHARTGIANALLHRLAPEHFKLEEIGRPYRGLKIHDIGKAFLNHRGVRTSNMSVSELVDAMLSRAGMHTTSDFPSLLEGVANKNLRAAYEAAPQTWRPLVRTVNLSDFKPSRQLQIGDAPELEEILEHGEFHDGTMGEGKETVQLRTYGKIFGITRQALINDDLNAFGTVPAAFGRKARDKESDLAWAQITSNPVMGDGIALFDAAGHANYTASGTAIGVDSLGVGRTSLRRQKGLDGVTLLNLTPKFLIVPATKETIADQFVSQITPAEGGKVNVFSGRLMVIAEPRLDDASLVSWYMATSPDQAPVLYYGTLDGQGGPDVRQEEGFAIDGVRFRCRIDVAFKAADWRAIYKNAGA